MQNDPLHPTKLHEINRLITTCRLCSLNKEPNIPGAPVPGIGAGKAKIMLLGEAPGEQEARPSGYQVEGVATGRPFVGKSGQGLKAILQELGYSFESTYITNSVKHRPPGNRNPNKEELQACGSHILGHEIKLVNPEVIVCLGRVPATAIATLAEHTLPSGTIRGHTFMYNHITVRCTWHPAYACGYNRAAEPELKSDLQSILKDFGP